MRGSAAFRQYGLTGWRAVERRFDTAFGSARNPLRHLGAIGFLAFWLLAISGVVPLSRVSACHLSRASFLRHIRENPPPRRHEGEKHRQIR